MKILFYITIILLVFDLTVSGCLEPSDVANISVNVLVNGSLIHGANGILFKWWRYAIHSQRFWS